MKSGILVRVAGQSILKNKLRTLLTMLGIIIGVGAVIMMVAVGAGARAEIQARINSLGTNLVVVTAGAARQAGVSQGAQTFNRLTVADAELLKNESFMLSGVSPVILTHGHIIGGAGNWRAPIMGVSTDYQQIRDWKLASGTFFSPSDQRTMRKVAVIGSTVAAQLWPDQDPVGQQIQLRNVPFKIIGVLAAKGQTPDGNDQDDIVLAPYTTVQTRLAGHQFIAQILTSAYSPEDIPAAMKEVTAIMREAHRLTAGETDDFTVRDQTDLGETAQETAKVMTLLLSAIASISLLVGGIGIMNIMLVSVTERTREIGLRLALGARGGDVLTQFLVESVVISIAGGLIGVALGIAGSSILGAVTGWSTRISAPTMVLALGFAAAVGIFFGFYPARRAAALDPIEALRYE